ncbi:MAG: Do family serine endopeptidase [Myxococcota bacterium]
MKTIGKFLVLGGLALAAVVATGMFEVRWNPNEAVALDLFGDDDDTDVAAAGEPFWQEGSNREPVVPRGVPGTFADLAEATSPGVVNISTEKTVVGHSLEDFFGPNLPFRLPRQPEFRERKRSVPSLGTGFVISKEGFIVTNNHVIEDVEKITVKFSDGEELPAEIVGRDPKTDIALIKVDSDRPLFALPLGDSESVRPGEWVVAIGNPFGLEHTVTAGIVSAKHRDIDHGAYDDYIQTDAAINPGNSGGPLLNLAGEVIGINTAINPRANTIGFAVPIDMAKGILPQLKANGRVTRGWLGVVIQGVSPEIAEELDLDEAAGALVSKVVEGGPADDAGIEKMDVIRKFDGQSVDDYDDLPRIVASTPVNKRVEIEVLRDGKRVTLRPKIAVLEEPEAQLASVTPTTESGADAFGLRVQDLSDDVAEQLGLDSTKGVVVSAVDPEGPAREAGIRRGDVILEVDRNEIDDAGELEQVLANADDRALMLIRRGENQLYMTVERAG